MNASQGKDARPGLVLGGRYRLARQIAYGGMATVWEATDDVLKRPVAVKIIHRHLTADKTFMARFRTEAVAVARLRHPSIVAIYDTYSDSDVEAIIMELIQGRTLRDYLDERGRLDPDESLQIGSDVAAALDCAHRAGIIHRDIKPANILLSDDGRVLVTDFGIAKLSDDTDLTSTGTMLGSVKYLAPEQVEGKRVDPRTDVYALGVVLYEATCGEPPFVGDSAAATALARLHQDPPSPRTLRPDLSAAMVALLNTCLARDPNRRFSSAEELGSAIEAVPSAGSVHWRNDPETTVIDEQPISDTMASAGRADQVESTVPDDSGPSATRTVRVGPLLLIALVAVAIVVAALLLNGVARKSTPLAEPGGSDEVAVQSLEPVNIALVTTFDPQGSGVPGENDIEAPLVIDGKVNTAWHSEKYASRRFGDLKAGVGLILTLEEQTPLEQLVVRSSTTGWSGSIFIADEPSESLSGWGRPAATLRDIAGDATFELGGSTGSFVLVWVTDLGEASPPLTATINEITVYK